MNFFQGLSLPLRSVHR